MRGWIGFLVRVALAIALAALAGCATVKPGECASAGGRSWLRVKTEHFDLITDGDVDDARTLAQDYERGFRVLNDLAFRSPTPPTERAEIIALVDRKALYGVIDPESGGKFSRDAIEDRPVIVTVGVGGREVRDLGQHELAHLFLRHFAPRSPPWLSEGLAMFWESASPRADGKVEIGVPTFCRRAFQMYRRGTCRMHELLAGVVFPSIDELAAATPDTFYQVDPRQTLGRYVAAWALVRALYLPTFREEFSTYLGALAGEQRPPAEAWRDLLARVDRAALDEEYRAVFAAFSTLKYWELEYAQANAPVPMETKPLGDVETHVLYARATPWTTDAARKAAEAQLEAALDHDPRSVDALLYRAVLRSKLEDFRGARVDLESAHAVAPNDPRVAWLLVEQLLAEQLATPAADRRWDHTEAAVKDLAKVARTAAHLEAVGRYFAARGRRAMGIPFITRAIERDPACWSCYETLADLEASADNHAQAYDAEALAISLYPGETTTPKSMVERLESFRAARDGLAPVKTSTKS